MITFLAAAANITLFGIGGAFWGLMIGLVAYAALAADCLSQIRSRYRTFQPQLPAAAAGSRLTNRTPDTLPPCIQPREEGFRVIIRGSFYPTPTPSWKQNSSIRSPTGSPTLPSAVASSGGIFDYDHKRERLTLLNKELEDPKIWDDAKARPGTRPREKSLEDIVLVLEEVDAGLADCRELFDMGRKRTTTTPCMRSRPTPARSRKKVAGLEFRRMFNNPQGP